MTDSQGIISWATSIRTSMYFDPGRQSLDDRIRSNGFHFLDGYFEEVLLAPKTEAIINLVKTPARKKDMQRSGVSNDSRSTSPAMLVDSDRVRVKDNAPPNSRENDLYQSLFDAQTKIVDTQNAAALPSESSDSLQAALRHTDNTQKLSIIAEGDEYSDRSLVSEHVNVRMDLDRATSTGPNSSPKHFQSDSQGHITRLPALPAPSPFRKSTQLKRDPSIKVSMTGTGIRTSWLVKTREITKATEKTSPPIAIINSPPQIVGTKRKSDGLSSFEESDKRLKMTRPQDVIRAIPPDLEPTQPHLTAEDLESTTLDPADGVMDRFRKTMEGLGARVGRGAGKSLGPQPATNALAEARAAAEARVAERNANEVKTISQEPNWEINNEGISSISQPHTQPQAITEQRKRLSVSDLVSAFETKENVASTSHQATRPRDSRLRSGSAVEEDKEPTISRTAPYPPPQPSNAVYEPVFRPPATFASRPLLAQPTTLGSFVFQPHAPEQRAELTTVSRQSTVVSNLSPQPSELFERGSLRWLQSTQDTECEAMGKSQEGLATDDFDNDTEVEDDAQPWTTTLTTATKSDDTWATDPTDGSRNILAQTHRQSHEQAVTVELIASLTPVVGASEPSLAMNETQVEYPLSSSTSLQMSFFGQASRLVSSVLGGKKNKAEPLKSLQLAAAAAKRQHEEAEKKATRLREMEARRQANQKRKADEEKARLADEEKKIREQGDKRKREREDQTERKVIKPSAKKAEDDTNLQNKDSEVAQPNSMEHKLSDSRFPAAPHIHANAPLAQLSRPAMVLPSAMTHSSEDGVKMLKMKNSTQSLKNAAKIKAEAAGTSSAPRPTTTKVVLPPQQMKPPPVPSESIELPDINSEYSDSDDEDRVRTFDPPTWAQSPELRQALQSQKKVNPDTIFGVIKPLRMDEIFTSRASKFRARSSSANWAGADQLTLREEQEYAKRMGFR